VSSNLTVGTNSWSKPNQPRPCSVKALLVGASPTDHSIITSCQNGHGRACKALRRWFNSTRRVQISESKSLVDVLARNQAAAGSIPASPTRYPSVGHWLTTCFGSTLNGVRFTALGPICWRVAQWQSTELITRRPKVRSLSLQPNAQGHMV
jgi:hypothetical protein